MAPPYISNELHKSQTRIEDLLVLLRAEIAKSEPILTERELTEYLLPFHTFEIAKLSLYDENSSLHDKLQQLQKAFLSGAGSAIFGNMGRQWFKDNYPYIANCFLIYQLFIIAGLAISAYFYFELMKAKVYDRLAMANQLVQANQSYFTSNGNKLLIFSNKATNRDLHFDYSTKRFNVHKQADQAKEKISYPSYNLDGGNVRIAISNLNLIYTPPDTTHFAGAFAGNKIIADGATDFSGNLIVINDEVLIVPEYPNCFLRKVFKEALPVMIEKLATHKRFGVLVKPRELEKDIIDVLYNKTMELFNPRSGMNNTERLLSPDLNILETIDILKFINDKSGVCRHRALVLAKLIHYAQAAGLLSGELRFRAAVPKTGSGHAWLEYRPQDYDKQDSNDYYFIDAMNAIFKHRTARESFFEKGVDGLIAMFESYSKPNDYPTLRNL